MKVLFIARHDLWEKMGGDSYQIYNTAKQLRFLGVDITIHLGGTDIDYNTFDLIHFFNIIDPEDILGHVLKSKKQYVISPIYVNYQEYDKFYRKDLIGLISSILPYQTVEYLKTLGKFLLKGEKVSTLWYFLLGNKRTIKYLLKHVSFCLPNSENEYKRLVNDFGVQTRYKVVTNAIAPETFKMEAIKLERKNKLILCVARLEGRKNQLNLIRAVKNKDWHLILIGAESENQKDYVELCKKEAGENVSFLGQLTQNELLTYYQTAKVHVLPSWFETTGLSSLEAAAMGCSIVVADRGDVRDYFADLAYYCNPADPLSIETAIIEAMNNKKNIELQGIVSRNYTWEIAAQQTLEVYKSLSGK